MSLPRETFSNFVKEVFRDQKYRHVKKGCMQTINSNNPQLLTRIFDYFPNPLSEEETKKTREELGEILVSLKKNNDPTRLSNWLKALTIKGCNAVLDDTGKVDDKLLDELGCKNKTPIPPWTLVVSYGLLVTQYIIPELQLGKSRKDSDSLDFIHDHMEAFAHREIKKRNPAYVYTEKTEPVINQEKSFVEELITLVIENPVPSAAAVGLLGFFGGSLVLAAATLYKLHEEEKHHHDTERPHK